MINGMKQRGVVCKDGKTEIQTSELSEGTVVEIIDILRDAFKGLGKPEPLKYDLQGYSRKITDNTAWFTK